MRVVTDLAEAGPPPKLVVLAFKPQKLDEIAAELRSWLTAKTVVVSLLAGVEAASLRERFPGVAAIVRAMPNLPVAIRRGVIGLYSADADDKLRKQVAELFVTLGFAMWMADEAKLAALGAVAGAGPAYVARFIDALAKAGEQRGLSREMAVDHRARNGARDRVDGGGDERGHGVDRQARRKPQGDDRGGPQGARPRQGARAADRAHDRGRRAARRRACRGGEGPLACRGCERALGASRGRQKTEE